MEYSDLLFVKISIIALIWIFLGLMKKHKIFDKSLPTGFPIKDFGNDRLKNGVYGQTLCRA
jgi:hypothetical protein